MTAVFREETGRLTAALVRMLGDFDLAEELVQESLLEAIEHWPKEGIPEKPGAWLLTTARRKAVDQLRRQARFRDKLAQLEGGVMRDDTAEGDDRLRLIFTCCHPALSREAQVALTLRAVAGLTTIEIARAFISSEATIAQRIVRAKRKIVDANIPYRIPAEQDLAERLDEVLSVLYLMFNEGYLATAGDQGSRRDVAEDAAWLAGLMVRLMPNEPEALGLLALMRLHLARAAARFDNAGNLVLLQDQDRGRWDQERIASAIVLLQRAATLPRTGPYQLQAAIAACHAEAQTWGETDWQQIVALYDALLELMPSPVVELNRAIARRYRDGASAALDDTDRLADALDGYYLFHATRAELLRDLGREPEARAALTRALELTANPAERALLQKRLS
ncbi:MAG TPA: sigma-70 family RNA polymerase sigma factor [Candidatus Dormibacteraeota bacterium]|nr:sigma-70 family RNA polymerase sigma factor [Candidatus Dormibacteraeota bacterium]